MKMSDNQRRMLMSRIRVLGIVHEVCLRNFGQIVNEVTAIPNLSFNERQEVWADLQEYMQLMLSSRDRMIEKIVESDMAGITIKPDTIKD